MRESSTKERLAGLLNETGDWRSGEEMSEALGVSRAAVAKQVKALRAEGYLIEAAPKRGYRLVIVPDCLDLGRIKSSLNSEIIGRGEWVWLPEAPSTNQAAAARAAAGLADGSVVLTDRQLTGRGRRGRAWFSPPRSLCCSVLLRPGGPAARLPWLTVAATAAVHRLVTEEAGLAARIKWPNDVLVKGRKLAGILVDSGVSGGEADWAAVGVGLNVNAVAADFPQELAGRAGSLLTESGRLFDRNRLYAVLLNYFDEFYRLWLAGREAELAGYWSRAADLDGRELKIATARGQIEGRAAGLDEDGRLLIIGPDGRSRPLESGDCQADEPGEGDGHEAGG